MPPVPTVMNVDSNFRWGIQALGRSGTVRSSKSDGEGVHGGPTIQTRLITKVSRDDAQTTGISLETVYIMNRGGERLTRREEANEP